MDCDITAAYKSKLDGIANNANNYSLPTASSSTLGGIKVGSGLSISNGVLSASGGMRAQKVSISLRNYVQSGDERVVTFNFPFNIKVIYFPAFANYGEATYSFKYPGDTWRDSYRDTGDQWRDVEHAISSDGQKITFTFSRYYTLTNIRFDANIFG